MRILFLGGTKFLGRHAVDAALARGHAAVAGDDGVLFMLRRLVQPAGGARRMCQGDDGDDFSHVYFPFSIFSAYNFAASLLLWL